MKYVLLSLLSLSLVSVAFLGAAEPVKKGCECKNCNCSAEADCGCVTGKGCTGPGCDCSKR